MRPTAAETAIETARDLLKAMDALPARNTPERRHVHDQLADLVHTHGLMKVWTGTEVVILAPTGDGSFSRSSARRFSQVQRGGPQHVGRAEELKADHRASVGQSSRFARGDADHDA